MTTPDSYRLQPFARRFLRDRCRCMWIGDSISSQGNSDRMHNGLVRKLRPRTWAGITSHPLNNGSLTGMQSGQSLVGTALLEPGSATLRSATKNFNPMLTAQIAFGSNVSNVYFLPQFILGASGMAQFVDGGAWWLAAGPRTARIMLYDHGDDGGGPTIPSLRIIRQRNVTGNPGAWVSDGSDTQILLAGADDYSTTDVTLSALADVQTRTYIHDDFPAIDETGKNLLIRGVRYWRPDLRGLELAYAGHGGWDVSDHLDTAKIDDSAITRAVEDLELDTIVIMCDANGPASKADREALIERWRAPILSEGRDFKCLLVAQYDLGTAATWEAVAADMYATAQEFEDVHFWSLYARMNGLHGPWASWQATYLSDGIHPNTAGVNRFAELMQLDMNRALGKALDRNPRVDRLTRQRY